MKQSTGHDPHTTVAEAAWDAARLIITSLNARTTALVSTGANETERAHLTGHLGRKTLQGAITRDFRTAWRKDKHGNTVPKLYRSTRRAARSAVQTGRRRTEVGEIMTPKTRLTPQRFPKS